MLLTLLTVAVVFLIVILAVKSHSISSGGSGSVVESTTQATTTSAPLLSAATFCTWRLGSHHVPLTSQKPVRLRIDDRCNVPRDPNPRTDSPTGVYSVALQEPAYQVGAIRDGQEIMLRCFTEGEAVADGVGNTSKLWLEITAPHGFVPNVDVGGGFTKNELIQLHLYSC